MQDLKIQDVAELLNVSEKTIQKWIAEGKIPTYQMNQQYYFSRSEIENWMISYTTLQTEEASPFYQQEDKIEELPFVHPSSSLQGSKQFSLFRAIHRGEVLSHLPGDTKEEIISTTMQQVAAKLHIDAEVMTDLLLDREALMPTSLNNGIAVPHPRDTLLNSSHDAVVVVFLDKPLDYGALDKQLVHTLFFLFACDDKRHLHLLSKIAFISHQKEALTFFKSKPSKEQLLSFVRNWESTLK